eukprot:gene10886-22729_t
MKALEQEALRRAREKIVDQFSEPSSLEELSSMKMALEKKLAAADSQLNAAVQSKLDALKRVVDLMDESTTKLDHFTVNMARIDSKISMTNTEISKYDHLKKVHNARENLQKTIEQVEYFARIPDRVQQLRVILDQDPSRLKEVYLETLKLESYGTALVREIRRNQHQLGSPKPRTGTSTGSGSGLSTGTRALDYYNVDGILTEVRSHLSVVSTLAQDVLSRLWANIDRMWDLASVIPADLVSTFEIIEMHQQLQDRRKVQTAHRIMRGLEIEEEEGQAVGAVVEGSSATLSSTAIPAGPLHNKEDIRYLAMNYVKRIMDQRLEASFTIMLEEEMNRGTSRVPATLSAATQLIAMMTVFKNEVAPCMP